jgi:hypothetical protein
MAKKKSAKKKSAPRKLVRGRPVKKKPAQKKAIQKKIAKKKVVKNKAIQKTARKRQPVPRILALADIKVIGGPLVLSPAQEVDGAESQLGIKFPAGYREYVTKLGEGVLGGYYIRVYPPRRILSGENNLQDGAAASMSIGFGTWARTS